MAASQSSTNLWRASDWSGFWGTRESSPLISSKGWKTTPLSTSFPLDAALHAVPEAGETRGAATTLMDAGAAEAAASWLAEAAAAAGGGETLSIISEEAGGRGEMGGALRVAEEKDR
nr:unnamed protein product [Digitaria exilis]